MKNVFYIFGILMLLSACASNKEQAAAGAGPVSGPVYGSLTLIRIEPEPAPPEVLVYMHGELAAVIGNESFVRMVLPEGTNTLTLDWEDSPIQFEEIIVLEPELRPEKYLSLIRRYDLPEISKTIHATDVTMVETLGLFEIPPAIGNRVTDNLDPDFSWVDGQYTEMPD